MIVDRLILEAVEEAMTMFHGTPKDFEKLKLNEHGILWLAFEERVGSAYAKPYYKDALTRRLWTIELKEGVKIIDMEDTTNPHIQHLISVFNDNPMKTEKITDEDWKKWYCDFATIEHKPWIRGYLKSKKVAGVIVNDNTSGKGDVSIDHKSLALFTLTAIQSATKQSI